MLFRRTHTLHNPNYNIAVQIRGLTADRAEGVAGGERG